MSARLLAALFAKPANSRGLTIRCPNSASASRGRQGAAARGHLLLVALAPHRGASLALQDVVAAALVGEAAGV